MFLLVLGSALTHAFSDSVLYVLGKGSIEYRASPERLFRIGILEASISPTVGAIAAIAVPTIAVDWINGLAATAKGEPIFSLTGVAVSNMFARAAVVQETT